MKRLEQAAGPVMLVVFVMAVLVNAVRPSSTGGWIAGSLGAIYFGLGIIGSVRANGWRQTAKSIVGIARLVLAFYGAWLWVRWLGWSGWMAFPVLVGVWVLTAVVMGAAAGWRRGRASRAGPGHGPLPVRLVGPGAEAVDPAWAEQMNVRREQEAAAERERTRVVGAVGKLCLQGVAFDGQAYLCTLGFGHSGPHSYEKAESQPGVPSMAVASLEEFERLYGPPPERA